MDDFPTQPCPAGRGDDFPRESASSELCVSAARGSVLLGCACGVLFFLCLSPSSLPFTSSYDEQPGK
jgi:hypothetical protein